MESAASSVELIFQSRFEKFNRKFAGLQQKKHFYLNFFETYEKILFSLDTTLLSYYQHKIATFSTNSTNQEIEKYYPVFWSAFFQGLLIIHISIFKGGYVVGEIDIKTITKKF
jgi:hypothetical protein